MYSWQTIGIVVHVTLKRPLLRNTQYEDRSSSEITVKSDWTSGPGTNFPVFILAQERKGKISLTCRAQFFNLPLRSRDAAFII